MQESLHHIPSAYITRYSILSHLDVLLYRFSGYMFLLSHYFVPQIKNVSVMFFYFILFY